MRTETDRLIALLDTSLVKLHLRAEDDKAAIRSLGGLLVEGGRVAQGFVDAVVQREAEFPTGLPTPGIKLALPHAGSAYVMTSAMAIAALEEPILFRLMGAPDQSVAVQIVFLLALRERDSQAMVLKTIMEIIQNEELLEQILRSASAEAVVQAIFDAARAS